MPRAWIYPPGIDGGVAKNIAEIAAAGADTFVAGSAIFNQPDYFGGDRADEGGVAFGFDCHGPGVLRARVEPGVLRARYASSRGESGVLRAACLGWYCLLG